MTDGFVSSVARRLEGVRYWGGEAEHARLILGWVREGMRIAWSEGRAAEPHDPDLDLDEAVVRLIRNNRE